MSTNTEGGAPAFPHDDRALQFERAGMTLREYAAIKLRVPESGTEWLDAMIRKSLRDELASKAMQGPLKVGEVENEDTGEKFSIPCDFDTAASYCYRMADAMLKASDA